VVKFRDQHDLNQEISLVRVSIQQARLYMQEVTSPNCSYGTTGLISISRESNSFLLHLTFQAKL